jgi:hypothetical protein
MSHGELETADQVVGQTTKESEEEKISCDVKKMDDNDDSSIEIFEINDVPE